MKFKPHKYQTRAIEFLLDTPFAALILGMGLGKCAITLETIRRLKATAAVKHVLVVAPDRVAKVTWPDEIAKWDDFRGMTCTVITGTQKQRLAAAETVSDIHTINFENLVWLINQFGKRWPWDMVVFDESSKMKSSQSKRFKAYKKIMPQVTSTVLLTGTPAPNSYLDLWAQIYLLDMGDRLGQRYTHYRARYFESDYMGYNWEIREGAAEKIEQRIEDLCLTMKTDDYLDLPEYLPVQVRVPLPLPVQALYRQIEKDFLVEISGQVITAANAAALSNKCLQLANGAMYVDDSDQWAPAHDAKIEALRELVDGSLGEPLLVAYNYRSDLERLLEAFPQARKLDTSEDIWDWNHRRIPIALAHPASTGHGLNLQSGGSTIVWFGLTWSLENYQQFNARLYRQGQTQPVVVHHLVAEGTVDELVMERLESKRSVQDVLMTALKRAA